MDHPQTVETENTNKAKHRCLPRWALIALAALAVVLVLALVPNKISAVGIEVPNRTVTAVRIRDVIESREFINHPSPVAFAVGKDIGG